MNDLAKFRGQVGPQIRKGIRLIGDVLQGDFDGRRASEGRFAGEQVVARDAEGVEIAAVVHRVALSLFRG